MTASLMLTTLPVTNLKSEHSCIQIHTPITDDVIRTLRIGQAVEITSVIYTARDAARRRMEEALPRDGALSGHRL